ncbi:MAG: 2-phospho-L-lactate transferase [Gammaproteobacteria bacterium]|nr:2-phospho-L-lactate transferase [Gammaproteobacteria bacterium]
MTVLALTGGVGGAKLALGLAHVMSPEDVVFLVNTGDDFEHFGLHISPDVDTLVYTLADQVNKETGWGRTDETWSFESSMKRLGGDTWFRLGDKDLATHVYRSSLLSTGSTLTEATQEIAHSFQIEHQVLPMSDDPVRTMVSTNEGVLPFQDYFVRRRCEPTVSAIEYQGGAVARLNLELDLESVSKVILCPSNPYLSIDPLLSISELAEFLQGTSVPVVAVSPIVKGLALKGPTAKMMRELGIQPSATTVASHYRDLISGFVLDQEDAEHSAEICRMGLRTAEFQTIMRTFDDRVQLARDVLGFCETLSND